MTTTRRQVLEAMGWGVAAGTWPRLALAQSGAGLDERLRRVLERHAGFGEKFSAGPGDVATAEWVAGRLKQAGYAVQVSQFDAPFFLPRMTRLAVGDAVAEVVPQAPVLPTGAAGVTAPLALFEGDDPGDVRGRIALIVTPFGRHAALFPTRDIGLTVTRAAAAGAVGIVIVTMGPSGEAVALNAPEEGPFVPVPAAVLAPKVAAPFVEAARQGAHATLTLDGEATHRPSPNVVAKLERGARWIAISTPRSGWFDCVAERGTGTAAFLELADWAARRFPERSIFVMNTGGHEYFFAGSHRVLHEAPPPEATLVWAHIGATLAARDAEERGGRLVMLDSADPQRSVMATDAARDAVAASFAGLAGLEQPAPVRPLAGELSTFTDRGFTTAFAVLGVHRWFHTVEDTLERVDARLLAPVVVAHQRAIERLAG